VLQHVRLPPRRGDGRERCHEFGRVAILECAPRHRLARCHQSAEALIGLRPMGHQRELVRGVEAHDVAHRPPCRKQRGEPTIGKDALDEVFAQPWIIEPPFLFDGQQGKAGDHGVGEQPAARLRRHPAGAIDLDALEAAGGRVFLQHETEQLAVGQFLDPAARVATHARGVILSRLVGQQANPAIGLHQPHRFPRGVQSGFDLRAHGHPVDELSE